MELSLRPPVRRRLFPWSTTTVRLADDARRCVVFLGHAAPGGRPESFVAGATGFFVVVAAPGYSHFSVYLITNKHCVRDGLEDPFVIRFNGKRGAQLMHVETADWLFHDDPNVDLAAMEIELPPGTDALCWPEQYILRPEQLAKIAIGAGDLTYTVGLFHYLQGQARNVPLVHAGHISAFPEDERIRVPDWDAPRGSQASRDIEGYVVQCSAMPGASGSPVFVSRPMLVAPFNHAHGRNSAPLDWPREAPCGYGPITLLGVWQGAWELNDVQMVGRTQVRSPSGYGIVVPGHHILEILDMPKPKQSRAARRKAEDEKNLPALDPAWGDAKAKR